MNAVVRLREALKEKSTREFRARGSAIQRCSSCLMSKALCYCDSVHTVSSAVGFCLLMFGSEAYKPTNTGRLIADIIPQTFAWKWSRTQPSEQLLTLLTQEGWQPILVFPHDEVERARQCHEVLLGEQKSGTQKQPLFVLLDGTWRQAKKMFRNSPYLTQYPVLSIQPDTLSLYGLRKSDNPAHLCTVEAAVVLLEMAKEHNAAQALASHFQRFKTDYRQIRSNRIACSSSSVLKQVT
ncbi:tRNA-uridine aminocarboxypropyltransferase [Algicola sagamiensis]|uniref:tRNA-uridine aminocarboxypropyltransferase n=1 Tax=Algicola sagamiensis TaxID=163869 RepID=UPI000361217C|nr:DTW domain-containing protein [Algicola sagamiensis]